MNYSGAQVYNSMDINTEDKNGIKNSYIRNDIWIWASKQLLQGTAQNWQLL